MANQLRTNISMRTGFDAGRKFLNATEVREYFTVQNINHMFGMGECDCDQAELDIMAEAVIRNRWHMVEGYTCIGNVRGSCGHKHKTLKAALACNRADQAACKRMGGYSDRYIRHVDGSPLLDSELGEMTALELEGY